MKPCVAITRGEPASAQHITGRRSEIPRDLNSVPEDKWEPTAALSAAGKDLTRVRQRNSQRAPPHKGFVFLHDASRNVTHDFLSR